MSAINLLLLVAAMICCRCATGQTDEIKPLKKGDLVPHFTIQINIGDSVKYVRLSDYKGKLLLLDFWSVNCIDCIAGLPKMLSLQQKFQGNLQIIVVTQNSGKEVQELWKRFENKAGSAKWVNAGRQLPFITSDSVLVKLFPHKVLPTHVWVNITSTFLATTYHTSTSEASIQGILENKNVILDEQNEKNINTADPVSWLDNSITNRNNIRGYSFFTGYLEFGAGGYIAFESLIDSGSNKPIGISCMNKSILDLYKEAYSDRLKIKPSIPDNRILLLMANKDNLFPPKDESLYFQWARDNTFCYGMKLPVHLADKVLTVMKSDLDKFFNLKSSIKLINVKCWLLKRISGNDRLRSVNQPEYFKTGDKLIIKNLPIKHLFNSLKNLPDIRNSALPFIDITNYQPNINIQLPWNEKTELISIAAVKKALQQFGLDLTIENVSIEMLVIENKL